MSAQIRRRKRYQFEHGRRSPPNAIHTSACHAMAMVCGVARLPYVNVGTVVVTADSRSTRLTDANMSLLLTKQR
jgi:hypothetical protein